MSGVITMKVKNPVAAQILMQYDDRVLGVEVERNFARKITLNIFHRNSTTSYEHEEKLKSPRY
jgi:hypothetical protein